MLIIIVLTKRGTAVLKMSAAAVPAPGSSKSQSEMLRQTRMLPDRWIQLTSKQSDICSACMYHWIFLSFVKGNQSLSKIHLFNNFFVTVLACYSTQGGGTDAHISLYKNLLGYSMLLIYKASFEISNLIGSKPILFMNVHSYVIIGKLS